jgi:hypothetical protein
MSNLVSVAKRIDPWMHEVELPYTATLYPAGFPLYLMTNSRDVMEAAHESWRYWQHEYDVEPLRFRVVVETEGEFAGPPVFRIYEHLVQVVSDRHNFANADMNTLVASIHVSAKTAADHSWLRWFFVESMAYMLLVQRYLVAIHAGCVARGGKGLLLCGKSGAGKSTLSFACARAGWTYVADDCTWLLADSRDRIAIGKPHQIRFREDVAEHFPELGGAVAQTRPNGKISIEVLMSCFPGIATSQRCEIGAVVFVDRSGGGRARLERVEPSEAIYMLLADLPTYGEEVNAIHERTIGGLMMAVPAWRMHYRTLDEALDLLSGISKE